MTGVVEAGGAPQSLGRRILLGTFGTAAINLSTVAVNFVLALVLARLLGASEFGAYAYALAWATFLSVPASLGLSPLVIRHVATYAGRGDWGLVRGVIRRATQSVAVAALVSVTGAALVGLVLHRSDPGLLRPFVLGLALIPLISLTTVRQAAMQGLNRVVLGRVPETLIVPGLFLLLVVAVAAIVDGTVMAETAVALNVIAALIGFLVGATLLRVTLPRRLRSIEPEYELGQWLRAGLPLLVLSILLVLNNQVGTILLGTMDSAASAGVFNVASRVALFTSFFWAAASYPLYPMVARMWAEHDVEALQRLLTRTARVTTLMAASVAVVLFALGGAFLGLFGADFEQGNPALRMLVVAEVVKVAAGFGGLALVMTPFEASMARAAALGVVVNVVATVALVPTWGVEGAAAGYVAGAVLSSVVMAVLAWRRLGIYTPAFGRRGARP